MPDRENPFRARIILLGASNTTRAIGTVIPTALRLLGSPAECFCAIGHGRSFGMNSRVLGRTLPGILECGLWKALDKSRDHEGDNGLASGVPAAALSTHALITDIGNDIMYGQKPERVTAWVEECINRLQMHRAQIGMTMLPINGLRQVTRARYRIVKSIMFPTRSLTFEHAIARAEELDVRIRALALRHNLRMVEPDQSWYGFDPIHVRYAQWSLAWDYIFRSAFGIEQDHNDIGQRALKPSPVLWARLRTILPEQMWLAGMKLGQTQPARNLSDASVVSMF